MKILIVDDKKENRFLQEALLKGNGYRVETAKNGDEAMKKLETEPFDLIISDILMPVMDGFQLCRHCKMDASLKKIPFVFYTATYVDQKDEIFANEIGADRFLRKPMDPNAFIKVIREVIEDAEKGKIEHRDPVERAEEETYRLYSERLVKKLEKKVLDLEKETAEHNNVAEALERSRREWEDIFHAVGHLTMILDPEQRILAVNRIGEKIIGYPADAIVGKKCHEVFHGTSAPPPGCPFRRSTDTFEAETSEMEVEALGRIFMISCTPEYNRDGKLEKVIHVATDITDLKHSEKALRESEELFRLSFDNANIGMCLVNLDGRLIKVNPKMCEIFGYKKEELESMSVNDITHPEDADVSPTFIKHAASGEVSHSEFEKRYFHKQGNIVWGRVSSSIIRDSQGAPIHFISQVQDISAQKAVEQALRESEQKYRLLMQNLPSIVFLGYEDWSVELFDDKIEQLTGYETDEFNSKRIKWIDIIVEEDIEPASKLFIKALKTDRSYIREYRIRSKDHGIKWIQERGHIICSENGGIDHVSGVFFDITQTKKLEAKLRQAQKMEAIGTLAGGVAHDFNNFLSVILGNADLMLLELKDNHPFFREIQEIRKAGTGAASLTRQLLAFSRKQAIQPEIMNLNDVIHTTTKMLGRLIGENIELQTILDPNLEPVKTDAGQMEQVVINLSINARDAMPSGGKLIVETKNLSLDEEFFINQGVEGKAGAYVMLRVSDTGAGMEEDILSHIFDPFFSTKGVERGTGLGLSTVYGIVKQNNGYIFVDSKPGKGSVFEIYLPSVQKEKKSVAAEIVAKDRLTGSETILIVEDDETLRKMVLRILEHYGYRVLQAANGDEAVEASDTHDGPVHLILTDVIMPGTNAREVAEKIQARRKGTKILYMSGYLDDTVSRHGVLESGFEFLEKPFTPKILAHKVREVLDRNGTRLKPDYNT